MDLGWYILITGLALLILGEIKQKCKNGKLRIMIRSRII